MSDLLRNELFKTRKFERKFIINLQKINSQIILEILQHPKISKMLKLQATNELEKTALQSFVELEQKAFAITDLLLLESMSEIMMNYKNKRKSFNASIPVHHFFKDLQILPNFSFIVSIDGNIFKNLKFLVLTRLKTELPALSRVVSPDFLSSYLEYSKRFNRRFWINESRKVEVSFKKIM
ncbi:MAG: hypothetical protein ACXQS8_04970, partial [Candidatus Helarchaeales archaeon]